MAAVAPMTAAEARKGARKVLMRSGSESGAPLTNAQPTIHERQC